jgi:hypothetical protein
MITPKPRTEADKRFDTMMFRFMVFGGICSLVGIVGTSAGWLS